VKRFAAFIGAVLLAAPVSAHAAPGRESNRPSPSRAARITEDINIKGKDPKMLAFDVVLPSSTPPNSKILYDRAVEGDMCFISCNFYNGVTSKWSDFYVSLQPFENFCMTLTGCANQYPSPSDSISISVNDARYKLDITDRASNSYYLPLELRKALAASASPRLEVEIAGVKMPIYKIGSKNAAQIATIANTTKDLDIAKPAQSSKTKEERLAELDSLRKKGLINDKELKDARLKILSE
jgi:hypothetical protein